MSEAVQNPQSSGSPAKGIETMSTEVTIEKLPLDLLLRVMEFVPMAQWPSLESVSRTFRGTIFEMWRSVRKIHLRQDLAVAEGVDSKTNYNMVLEKLTRRAPNISKIGGFGRLNEDSIDLLVRFEKLGRIEFGGWTAPLSELGRFLKESASRSNLKEINAADSMPQTTAPGQEALSEAFHGENGLAPLKLETLDLSKSWDSGWSFLSAVDVSRLTSFNVIDTHVSRSLFVSFLNRATKLKRLGFSFDCYRDEQPRGVACMHADETGPTLQLNKKIIRAVGELGNLFSLTCTTNSHYSRDHCECRNFDGEMIQMVEELGRRGTLKGLSLWGMGSASPELTNSVAMALQNLSALEMSVSRCDEATLELILKAQKALVHLKLRNYRAFPAAPASVVPHIMDNAHHLKVLHLDSAWSDISKKDLLQVAAFKHLKELRLLCVLGPNANSIDDTLLVGWADTFGSKLETLEISAYFCGKITDEGLLPLIKKMPRLRILGMRCLQITDVSLKEMSVRCPDLRELNLGYCSRITVEGVQAVVDGCEYLKRFFVPDRDSFKAAVKIPKYSKVCFYVCVPQ